MSSTETLMDRRLEDLDDDIPGSDLDDDLESALSEPREEKEDDEDDLFGEPPGADPDDPADDDW